MESYFTDCDHGLQVSQTPPGSALAQAGDTSRAGETQVPDTPSGQLSQGQVKCPGQNRGQLCQHPQLRCVAHLILPSNTTQCCSMPMPFKLFVDHLHVRQLTSHPLAPPIVGDHMSMHPEFGKSSLEFTVSFYKASTSLPTRLQGKGQNE